MKIQIKRAYDAPSASDGKRILVDRLWPRGIKKDDLKIEAWYKDLAPSNDLRHWYGHDPEKWDEFRKRYFKELNDNKEAWQPLLEAASSGPVTLVYSAKETQYNNAEVLKEYLERHLKEK